MKTMLLLISLSFLSVGCATTPQLAQADLAMRIVNADKIDVSFHGKNGNHSATVKSWPEAFKFIGNSATK